jgi:hypothetical protein
MSEPPRRESGEQVLRARGAELASCLRDVADSVTAAPRSAESFVVTGIGASEGPARAMAALLRSTWNVRAMFAPLSTFAVGEPRAHGDALVIFSQSLSPNACLALDRAREFTRALLFTSAPADAASGPTRAALDRFREHGTVLTFPRAGTAASDAIARERGTLVRVLGPCAAMLAGAMHVGAATPRDVPALLDAIDTASARARAATSHVDDTQLEGRVAFVTAGEHGELSRGIGSLWLEALYAPCPPMWDVLEVAHGPFQELYESPILLVAFERAGREVALFDRLAAMLVPGRHTLVRLTSELPAPLAPLCHLAQVNELVCRALRARPRDLRAWPGAGHDGPLYELGVDPRVRA